MVFLAAHQLIVLEASSLVVGFVNPPLFQQKLQQLASAREVLGLQITITCR